MIKKTTDLGNIDISTDVIATICGGAATECYGVVGMASQNILKDGIAEILKKENFNDDFVFKNVLVFNIQKLEIDFNHFRKFCIDNLNEHILNKNKIEEKTWNDITCVLNNDVFKSKTTNNKKIKL